MYAWHYEFYDDPLAERIIQAESGWNCKAQNPYSSAGGLFQFTDGTWLSTQKRLGITPDLATKYDCHTNMMLGIFLLSQGEYHHWNASKTKW